MVSWQNEQVTDKALKGYFSTYITPKRIPFALFEIESILENNVDYCLVVVCQIFMKFGS